MPDRSIKVDWPTLVKNELKDNKGKSLREVLKIAKKKYNSSRKLKKLKKKTNIKKIKKIKKTVKIKKSRRRRRRRSSHIHTKCIKKAIKKCNRHKH